MAASEDWEVKVPAEGRTYDGMCDDYMNHDLHLLARAG